MRTLLYLFPVISVFFLISCSDNSSNITDYNWPYPGDVEEILNQAGSPDAPVLYISIGIESGVVSLNWTEIEGAYYELEECDNPYFNLLIYNYLIYQTEFPYDIKNGFFYRVRAYTPAGLTGWSNVVIGSHGALL